MTARARSVSLLVALHVAWVVLAGLLPSPPDDQARDRLGLPVQLSELEHAGGLFGLAARVDGEPVALRWLCRSERGLRVSLYCLEGGERFYPLGTDDLGRCRLSRIVHGGLASMTIALGAVVVALGLGLLIGLLSALSGPRLDGLLTLGVDVGRALPWLLLVLALRARRPLEMAPLETLASLALILGLSGWFSTSRLVRIRSRQLLEEHWIDAARGLGLSPWRIGLRHLRPHLSPLLIAQALALVPAFVVAETSLSFIGLGVVDPGVSWGSLLGELRYRDVILERPGALFVLLPLLVLNLAYLWTAKYHRFD